MRTFTLKTSDATSEIDYTFAVRAANPKASNILKYRILREAYVDPTPTYNFVWTDETGSADLGTVLGSVGNLIEVPANEPYMLYFKDTEGKEVDGQFYLTYASFGVGHNGNAELVNRVNPGETPAIYGVQINSIGADVLNIKVKYNGTYDKDVILEASVRIKEAGEEEEIITNPEEYLTKYGNAEVAAYFPDPNDVFNIQIWVRMSLTQQASIENLTSNFSGKCTGNINYQIPNDDMLIQYLGFKNKPEFTQDEIIKGTAKRRYHTKGSFVDSDLIENNIDQGIVGKGFNLDFELFSTGEKAYLPGTVIRIDSTDTELINKWGIR